MPTNLTSAYGLPDSVRVEAHGPVRVITLNRPEAYNSVVGEMHQGLIDVWGAIAADPDARSVVITGAGRAFSSGGDFTMFQELLDDPVQVQAEVDNAHLLVRTILAFKLPVVAAVNGAAVGLGCALATLSDVVIMSDKSFLQDPHVAVGLVAADGGSLAWPFLTSMLNAKEHILLGTRIVPDEAKSLGLANRVVAHDDLMSLALDYADRFAALPPQAVQETKRALNMHLEALISPVLDHAIAGEAASFSTPEFRAIVTKFLAKG
jgi:enoyl-CoA hydratase